MISVNSAFSKFINECKSLPEKKTIHKIIQLFVRGLEVSCVNEQHSCKVLYINMKGILNIGTNKTSSDAKSIPFNNLVCSYTGNIVNLFDISCNETFYKIELAYNSTAISFSERYNQLVDSFNNFKKIAPTKKQYFKLD